MAAPAQHRARAGRGTAARLQHHLPLLKRLEARGLLSRHRRPDDERSVEVTLTEEGHALRERCAHVPDTIAEAMGIDAETMADLQHVLRRVTASATGYAEAR
ncbi:MarR family winged helix-turn-helix transcriptional regulator [Thermocatellispora tengchongensis]|uniref:MarR family winged helix-turn-helix transcriptional regulator n=1 Tax=Thermocatellispora tengchongensis TaxID=1073253 RepID=UPI003637CC2F